MIYFKCCMFCIITFVIYLLSEAAPEEVDTISGNVKQPSRSPRPTYVATVSVCGRVLLCALPLAIVFSFFLFFSFLSFFFF